MSIPIRQTMRTLSQRSTRRLRAAATCPLMGRPLTFTSDGNSFAPLTIEVATNDDNVIEGVEDFTVSIANPGSTTGSAVTLGTDSVTTTIIDNDTSTWDIFGTPSVTEGGTAQYNLFLSGTLQTGETATIDLSLGDVDTNSADYANFVAAVNTAVAGRTDSILRWKQR